LQSINFPSGRKSFFERVNLNHAIVDAYDQLVNSGRVVSVSLARREAPLGRPLTAQERVTVQWTVNAPEDEARGDKPLRRQQRIIRLLLQAEAQGAAPTDDDLAEALNVSRRTILRDLQEMAQKWPYLLPVKGISNPGAKFSLPIDHH
jgi:hypothetical protein